MVLLNAICVGVPGKVDHDQSTTGPQDAIGFSQEFRSIRKMKRRFQAEDSIERLVGEVQLHGVSRPVGQVAGATEQCLCGGRVLFEQVDSGDDSVRMQALNEVRTFATTTRDVEEFVVLLQIQQSGRFQNHAILGLFGR